jgi:hypothetical protein
MGVVVVIPPGSSASGGEGPRECRENLRCNESRLAKTLVSEIPLHASRINYFNTVRLYEVKVQ